MAIGATDAVRTRQQTLSALIDVATLTISVRGVFHITQLDNGSFHETSTLTGTARFVPDDPSQPSYRGTFTEWDGTNLNAMTFTATDTVNIVLRGSDGSMVKQHALFRMTVTANGTVTSVITTDEFTCP